MYGRDISAAMAQKYTGDVTILPRLGGPTALLRLVQNPTRKMMEKYIQEGQLAAFEKLTHIRHVTALERELSAGLAQCMELREYEAVNAAVAIGGGAGGGAPMGVMAPAPPPATPFMMMGRSMSVGFNLSVASTSTGGPYHEGGSSLPEGSLPPSAAASDGTAAFSSHAQGETKPTSPRSRSAPGARPLSPRTSGEHEPALSAAVLISPPDLSPATADAANAPPLGAGSASRSPPLSPVYSPASAGANSAAASAAPTPSDCGSGAREWQRQSGGGAAGDAEAYYVPEGYVPEGLHADDGDGSGSPQSKGSSPVGLRSRDNQAILLSRSVRQSKALRQLSEEKEALHKAVAERAEALKLSEAKLKACQQRVRQLEEALRAVKDSADAALDLEEPA